MHTTKHPFIAALIAAVWFWTSTNLWALPLWSTAGIGTAGTVNTVNHAVFGGSQYLRVSSATPSGLGDSVSGTIAFWVRFNGPDLTSQFIFSIGNGATATFFVARSATLNQIVVSGYDQFGNEDINIRSTTGITAAMGWTHVMATWTVGANTTLRNFYINGVADTPIAGNWDTNSDGINYSISGTTRVTIGGTTADTPLALLNGGLAELWFNDTRNNVIADYYAGGKAVPLGSTGELAIGTPPVFYYCFGGRGDSWTTNGGSGGALTKVGTLTTDPTPPEFP